MKKFLILTALLCTLSACGGGSNGDAPPALPAETQASIDQIVQQQLTAQNLPGAVVLVSIPGEGEMVKAYGQANLETGLARNAADPFRIASITKTFIGTLILQLVDDGLIALADPLSTWYPGFPNGDVITIDHLLRMRSGMADPVDFDFLRETLAAPTELIAADELVARAAARSAEFVPPDSETRYNNLNFIMLGEIAAKVSGQDIRTLLAERIARPLGMSQTVYPVATELGGSNRGYLFDPTAGRFEDVTVLNTVSSGGAGAIISTAEDLKRYARALCTGSLLKPQTQALRMQGTVLAEQPEFIEYGAGVVKFGRFCGHNGTAPGFSSEMFYLPEKDAVIVVNVNRLDFDDHSKSIELLLLLTKQLFPQYTNW